MVGSSGRPFRAPSNAARTRSGTCGLTWRATASLAARMRTVLASPWGSSEGVRGGLGWSGVEVAMGIYRPDKASGLRYRAIVDALKRKVLPFVELGVGPTEFTGA